MARGNAVCVMVCVITRRFGAHGKGFHRCPLRFHPHVTVSLQHATAHVSGNRMIVESDVPFYAS